MGRTSHKQPSRTRKKRGPNYYVKRKRAELELQESLGLVKVIDINIKEEFEEDTSALDEQPPAKILRREPDYLDEIDSCVESIQFPAFLDDKLLHIKASIRQLLCDSRVERKEVEPDWYFVRAGGEVHLVTKPENVGLNAVEANNARSGNLQVGDDVRVDNVSGSLLCSSHMGVSGFDIFNHFLTEEDDMRSFIGAGNCDEADRRASLSIKSYLKFCSITDTPHWRTEDDQINTIFEDAEAEAAEVDFSTDAIDEDVIDEDDIDDNEEDDDWSATVDGKKTINFATGQIKRWRQLQDRYEERVVKCCALCDPSLAPISWPTDVPVRFIDEIMSKHLSSHHEIEDTTFKENQFEASILLTLRTQAIKEKYNLKFSDRAKSRLPKFNCSQCSFKLSKGSFYHKNQLLCAGIHIKYHEEQCTYDYKTYENEQLSQFVHKCRFERTVFVLC